MSAGTPSVRSPAEVASLVARRLAERHGEWAVIGLGRSGRAVSRLLRAAGLAVYASDAVHSPTAEQVAGELRSLGVAVDVGGHDLERIGRASVLVVSPGVPPEAAPLMAARAAGVPVVSEVEVALRLVPGLRYIATTGTNGKTTVTALIGHLLRALGVRAEDVGNIGTPVSELALRDLPPEWAALEVSSFQLHDTPGILPNVGVLTTLSPDHLDRYTGVEAYYADKRRLFANASVASVWVTTADNADVDRLITGIPGRWFRFSLVRTDVDAWLDRSTGWLQLLGAPFMPRSEIPLVGDHNIANVCTALLAVCVADPAFATAEARATLVQAVTTFRPPPHRLEPVLDRTGILWLNDSKATNVASTLVAIDSMTRPTILLLGGRHKGEPYTTLVPSLLRHAKAVLAFGEATAEIIADLQPSLQGRVMLEAMPGAAFEAVVARARALAVAGDVILLSPACSSYDMFKNFEERGRDFTRLADQCG